MSETTKNLKSFIVSLCQKAEDLGAAQAIPIPVTDIVVDERAVLKCLVPLCPHYGIDLVCPPTVLPVSKFRELLKGYHSAILIKVDIPVSDLPRGGKEEERLGAPKVEYPPAIEDTKKRLYEIVSQVESTCIEGGYPFAAGLAGGSCPLCEECVGVRSGLPCRHPFKARPAMEAMGIDVVTTAEKAGLNLSFGQNEGRSWVGLVLVA